ncbi:MAG: mechanosensitive ion channel protein, partial [Cyanobacteriota bacterium]|nr:mechanosensitive ion channel protein [Cyanobacteriota bacterium]
MSLPRLRPLVAALLAGLVLALSLTGGGLAAPTQPLPLSTSSLGSDLIKGATKSPPVLNDERNALSAGSFSVGKVRVLGVPVIAVAVPVLKGSTGLDAQARARLIEANLRLLYAPEAFCSQIEQLSEGLLEHQTPGLAAGVCRSDLWGIGGDPSALTIESRLSDGGQPVLQARLPGRDRSLPLLTVTDADARLHGLPAAELANRWADLLQRRLRDARRELEPGSVFDRVRRLLLLEILVFAVLVLVVWSWSRTRGWLQRLLEQQLAHPSTALNLRVQLVMVLRRGLFLSVLVGVMVMVALAVMAVPGQ